MAKSEAKKQRMKLEREGKLNPEMNRASWNGVVPVEKRTPTLRETKARLEAKHKKKWNRALQDSGGSISFFFGSIRAPISHTL